MRSVTWNQLIIVILCTLVQDVYAVVMADLNIGEARLPISQGQVWVDNSVDELKLVVDTQKDSLLTEISSPSGLTFDHYHLPAFAHWQIEGRQDIVTISHPEQGAWKIHGGSDGMNIAIAKTPIQFRFQNADKEWFQGEAPEFQFVVDCTSVCKKTPAATVTFYRNQKVLAENISATVSAAQNGQYTGRFALPVIDETGNYFVLADVKDPYFERVGQLQLAVRTSPLVIKAVPPPITQMPYLFVLSLKRDDIDRKTLEIHAHLTDEKGETTDFEVPVVSDDAWEFGIPPRTESKRYDIRFDVDGRFKTGRKFAAKHHVPDVMVAAVRYTVPTLTETLNSKNLEEVVMPPLPEQNIAEEISNVVEVPIPIIVTPKNTDAVAKAPNVAEKKKAHKGIKRQTLFIIMGCIVLVNILLMIGAYFFTKHYLRKSKQPKKEKDTNEGETVVQQAQVPQEVKPAPEPEVKALPASPESLDAPQIREPE